MDPNKTNTTPNPTPSTDPVTPADSSPQPEPQIISPTVIKPTTAPAAAAQPAAAPEQTTQTPEPTAPAEAKSVFTATVTSPTFLEPTEPVEPVSTPPAQPTQAPGSALNAETPSASAGAPVVVSGGEPTPPTNGSQSPAYAALEPPKKRRFDIRYVAAGGAVLLLIVIGLGFYFGYYMNSTVVYKSALSRSGKGLVSLTDYAKKQSEAGYKGSNGTGSFKYTSSSFSTDGNIAFKSDDKNSQTTFDVGLGATRLNGDIRTIQKSTGTTPDVYFKASGIKGLGDMLSPEFGAKLDALDSQWITVDHSLLDTLANSGEGSLKLPTRSQIFDEVDAFQQVNQQYVFTGDEDKSVFRVLKSYGKESSDGRSIYRYKVGFQKEHVTSYLQAQHDALIKSKLGTWIKDSKQTESVDSYFKDAKDSVKDIKSSDTFDLYVDAHQRIIYKARFAETKNPATNYVDVGLKGKQGDTLPFFIAATSDSFGAKSKGSVTATLNTKTNLLELNFNFKQDGSDGGTLTGKFSLKPGDQSVKIDTPTGAKQLSEVLQQFNDTNPFTQFESSPMTIDDSSFTTSQLN